MGERNWDNLEDPTLDFVMGSRIERYGLGELVIRARDQDGLSFPAIAKLCNQDLKSRTDGKTYRAVRSSTIADYYYYHSTLLKVQFQRTMARRFRREIVAIDEMRQNANVLSEGIQRLASQDLAKPKADVKTWDTISRLSSSSHSILSTILSIQFRLQEFINAPVLKENLVKFLSALRDDSSIHEHCKSRFLMLLGEIVFAKNIEVSLKQVDRAIPGGSRISDGVIDVGFTKSPEVQAQLPQLNGGADGRS